MERVLSGNDKVGVNAEHRAETFAGLAGTIGVVEGEEVNSRLFEGQPVALEAVREGLLLVVRRSLCILRTGRLGESADDLALTVALEEGGLDRVGEAETEVFVEGVEDGAVNEDMDVGATEKVGFRVREQFLDEGDRVFDEDTGVAFLEEQVEFLDEGAAQRWRREGGARMRARVSTGCR